MNLEVQPIVDEDENRLVGFLVHETTPKGKVITKRYAAVEQRAVNDFINGLETYKRDTKVHYHVEGATRVRRIRAAGRGDAISTMNLEVR